MFPISVSLTCISKSEVSCTTFALVLRVSMMPTVVDDGIRGAPSSPPRAWTFG
jgi:hypothetical protein